MRSLARLVLFAAAIAAPAHAAQQFTVVTVAQVSKLLEDGHGEKDAKFARLLSTLQLSERADQVTLAKWQAEFFGKRTRRALTELADASAFLDPPRSEIPANAPPDAAEMSRIVLRAVDYVNKTMPRLPDFYAERTTTHFENAPALQQDLRIACGNAPFRPGCLSTTGANAPLEPTLLSLLRFEGASTDTVTYRDGKELANRHWEGAPASQSPQLGLVTTGEFGPILLVALGDALHGKIFWSSWQRSAAGALAVFRFRVTKDESHFQVTCPTATGLQTVMPAYHGELAISPSTGAVYRITMVSDLDPPNQDQQASIAVDYDTVSIGGAPYVCPVRGVAFSRVPVFIGRTGEAAKLPEMQTRLNDIAFTRYHLFRAEMKILPDAAASSPASPATPASPAH